MAGCNKAPTVAGASTSATASASKSPTTHDTDLADNATGAPALESPTPAASSATSPPESTDSASDGVTDVPTSASLTSHGDACSLITQQEAATALGADPGPGDGAANLGASSCTFGSSPALVSVNVLPTNGMAALKNMQAHATGHNKLTPVPGIGDAAFIVTGGPSASVMFAKGDAMVAVLIVASGAPTPASQSALTLARLAASRL